MNIFFNNEFDFKNQESVNSFLGPHSIEHSSINKTIASIYNTSIMSIPLFDFGDYESWFMYHDMVHRQIFNVIGVGNAPSLNIININDKIAVDEWQQTHQDMHVQISRILGV